MTEFSNLLKRIDKELTREELEYIFNKLDEDGSNSIEFNEFEKWLKDNNVNYLSMFRSK
jgi:Ca2+-binding EF-hand superfamily protein